MQFMNSKAHPVVVIFQGSQLTIPPSALIDLPETIGLDNSLTPLAEQPKGRESAHIIPPRQPTIPPPKTPKPQFAPKPQQIARTPEIIPAPPAIKPEASIKAKPSVPPGTHDGSETADPSEFAAGIPESPAVDTETVKKMDNVPDQPVFPEEITPEPPEKPKEPKKAAKKKPVKKKAPAKKESKGGTKKSTRSTSRGKKS